MGASPGGFGTILAQAAWLPVLRTLGTRPWFGGRLMVSRGHRHRSLGWVAAAAVPRRHVHRPRRAQVARLHDPRHDRLFQVARPARLVRLPVDRHGTGRRGLPDPRHLAALRGAAAHAADDRHHRHGARQEGLAVQQQGRRMGKPGVLDRGAAGPVSARRRCRHAAGLAVAAQSDARAAKRVGVSVLPDGFEQALQQGARGAPRGAAYRLTACGRTCRC